MVCSYKYAGDGRPGEQCNRPGVSTIVGEPRCCWHTPHHPQRTKAQLEQAVAAGEWLEGAQLEAMDLEGANLTDAKLPYAELQGVSLSDATLAKADLHGAVLTQAKLKRAILNEANLTGSCCIGTDFSEAHLESSRLSATELRNAKLDGAWLAGAALDGLRSMDAVEWGTPGEHRNGLFSEAALIYRGLGRMFREASDHGSSVNSYFNEMTCLHLVAIGATQHRSRSLVTWFPRAALSRPISWIGWAAHRWIWGYGVRPGYTLAVAALVVLLFAVLFASVNILYLGNASQSGFIPGLTMSAAAFLNAGDCGFAPKDAIGFYLRGLETPIGMVLINVFLVSMATRFVHRG